MLDRLQKDDRVAGGGEGLDQGALEAQVRPHVAQPGVLVRLRVGVDADDLGRRAREDVGAVPLAAGQVGDPQPDDTGADPLIHGEVATEPVVLLRHVGQRALTGELERRHAGWLMLLDVDLVQGR